MSLLQLSLGHVTSGVQILFAEEKSGYFRARNILDFYTWRGYIQIFSVLNNRKRCVSPIMISSICNQYKPQGVQIKCSAIFKLMSFEI